MMFLILGLDWYIDDTWIVVVGALCAMACSLPGCFLVLRRMSMMGDAISHAVLPGLAAAFLFTGARTSFAMFIGAAVVGVLTALFTQWISTFGRVERGAAMGIVFTTLFALGLILIVQGADHVDLDPKCVLYGSIEFTPIDVAFSWQWGETLVEVPRAAVVLFGVLVVNLAVVLLLFKELRLSSFDPELATTLGINATFMHYLLMTITAVTTVAAFEAVGSIIVIAMLIVPAAAAYLLTHRLWVMVIFAVVIGAVSAAGGHVLAIVVPPWFGDMYQDTNTAGMMAVTAGLLFVVAWGVAAVVRVLGHRAVMQQGAGTEMEA